MFQTTNHWFSGSPNLFFESCRRRIRSLCFNHIPISEKKTLDILHMSPPNKKNASCCSLSPEKLCKKVIGGPINLKLRMILSRSDGLLQHI
jgi:hypothetical protein